MALEEYALITLSSLKARLGITGTDNDAELETRINEVSYRVHGDGVLDKGYIGRHLKSKTYTDELYQATNEQELILDAYPITNIASISYRSVYSSNFNLLDSDEYFIHRNKWCVVKETSWFKHGYGHYLSKDDLPFYSIKVTYTAGYTTIPFDIQDAVKGIIADEYYTDTSGGQGVKTYKISDVSIEWDKSIRAEYRAILNKYKRRF